MKKIKKVFQPQTKQNAATREVLRRAKLDTQVAEGKSLWCVRCKSQWCRHWATCQRCGWGHATDKNPIVKEFKRA